jgi:hypothetical protein
VAEFDDIAAEARDEVYAMFGKIASYVAPGGGASSPCTILLDMRDRDAKPDDGRPLAGQVTLQVRASEIAAPLTGGVFTLDVSEGGTVYTIANRPLPVDAASAEWTMWGE